VSGGDTRSPPGVFNIGCSLAVRRCQKTDKRGLCQIKPIIMMGLKNAAASAARSIYKTAYRASLVVTASENHSGLMVLRGSTTRLTAPSQSSALASCIIG